MAGPILIFDKSSLQSLNIDESAWLDNSYLSVITPLFFIETLADLEKEVKSGKSAEDVVGILAEKTPDLSGSPTTHHMSLINGELLGIQEVDIKTGRPHITGGKPMEIEGRTGLMYGPTPEEEAFHRWQRGEFLELERTAAKAWRVGLAGVNLEDAYNIFKEWLPGWSKPKDLTQLKNQVDEIMNGVDQESLFRMGLSLLNVDEGVSSRALERWRNTEEKSVKTFAPYFAFVYSIDLFFYLGIASDLIGRGRASHKVDIAYLYYLPFCMVFTSNDKLHRDIAPLFMRGNQSFIVGTELKKDLADLDEHYSKLPDEVKDRGTMSFAFYPPEDDRFLLTKLWDKHMNPNWRVHKQEHDKTPPTQPKDTKPHPLMEAIREAESKGSPMKPYVPSESGEPNHIVIKRNARARKGKWERFPPEVRNRKKNAQGEWEDIPPQK